MMAPGDVTADPFSATLNKGFVMQGEFKISGDPTVVLTTLLGSCVATCLFDPIAAVGGMNHFLLPTGQDGSGRRERFGLHAMERMIAALVDLGASKSRLQAKVFGAAVLEKRIGDMGRDNARFALGFLQREGIPCLATSLGGEKGRELRFVPTTGSVSQRLFSDPLPVPADPSRACDITFFEE